MSDISVVLIGFMVMCLILIPVILVVAEKTLVLSEMEAIEDMVDLAIEGVVMALDRETLGEGELAVLRKDCRNRVRDYLQINRIPFYNLEIILDKKETLVNITVDLEAILMPHVFKRFLPKEVPYEIIRKYQILLDR